MYSAYSFVTIQSMIDNEPGQLSALGELSGPAMTFSREKGIYGSSTAPSVRIINFRSTTADDSTNTTTLITMPTTHSDALLAASQWFAEQSIAGTFTADAAQTAQFFTAEFSNFTLQDIGKMYVNSAGQYLPGSITVKLNTVSEDNVLRLWFADEAFRSEYGFYEIQVLPPVDNIDDLTKDYEDVIPVLQALTIAGQLKRADAQFSQWPTTHLLGRQYAWYDFEDATQTTPATFVVAIWGAAGNNDDAIRDAIRDYILDNSEYGQDRWEIHFPDLFIPTEFYIIPLWDRFSIPFQTLLSGVYSPTVKPADAVTIAEATMDGYATDWITSNLDIAGTVYKSVVFLALGNEKNRLAKPTFAEQWPGYAALSTTHIDFDRLDSKTQAFILLLNDMLFSAETLTEYSDLPTGMTRVTRNGKLYLSASLYDCQYLMLTKAYFVNQTDTSE